jgi:hypothetical protein
MSARRPAVPARTALVGLVALVALVALAATVACGPPADQVVTARLGRYFDAVQTGGPEGIADLLGPCSGDARATCLPEIERLLAAVAAQREAGEYDFADPWGFGLVVALVLGRGGYWTVDTLDLVGERATLGLVVRTQYRPDETRGLPHGAVIEYLGRPLGHVESVPRGGGGPGTLRWQLDELRLTVRFVRAAGSDDDWRVEVLEVEPDSAVFSRVTWRPQ